MFDQLKSKLNLLLDKDKTNNNLRYDLKSIEKAVQELKMLEGKNLALQNIKREQEILNDINKAEFKVFSQWGDDGILQFLIDYLAIENKLFVEFGVEDYLESNTRYILINNCWKGLVIDGSEENINKIKQNDLFWQYQLDAVCSFITKENINELLNQYLQKRELGILVIDIDGNDYWIWEAIEAKPIIVVVEYNSVMGYERAISIPYKANFKRNEVHFSNLYFGASLAALNALGVKKGYTLIACNTNGNNAFFVRNDCLKDLKKRSVEQAFRACSFREARNKENKLTYLNYVEATQQIKGLEVINIDTSLSELI